MKLQFDSNQSYQRIAINSVVNLFQGQPLQQSAFEVLISDFGSGLKLTQNGVANNLVLTDEQLRINLKAIQETNQLKNGKDWQGRNFTVEMETGTGKTYTYLRTIYELNQQYGFKKFVIVVPSVAIREGTLKNLTITRQHFKNLYNNPSLDYSVYDSKKLSALRSFATANSLQILVLNIDSFTRDDNVINQLRETGIRPIEYVTSTNPIVIIDEPQNMETEVRRKAITDLLPMKTLRYSATHKNYYNLVYRLSPVKAYELGLVKQIEIDGVQAEQNYNAAFIQLEGIQTAKRNIRAKLKIYVNDTTGVRTKTVTAEVGSDLFELSNSRAMYQDGFIINSINAGEGFLEFSNGLVLNVGQSQGGLNDDVLKFMVKRTIERHFEKERRLSKKGIKVLSLFFIDRVANYRDYDAGGNVISGKFARWFEELYTEIANRPINQHVIPFNVADVHNGYFSTDKGRVKDTNGATKADDDTYNLIMKDKERLLSNEEPLRFIFSHSALREGWDNPNVFQICTLNESRSELKKRQEIGRGLRLCVDSEGARVQDKTINVLTVIANETYQDFANTLQKEIEEDTGEPFKGKIRDANEKAQIKLTKQLIPDNYPEFFELWDKIKNRTRYRVSYDTAVLTKRAIEEVRKMPPTVRPQIVSETALLEMEEERGLKAQLVGRRQDKTRPTSQPVPDVYAYIQGKVDLTRQTIFEILKGSERLAEITSNPQQFLDNVVSCIQRTLNRLMVNGIKYERIQGQEYAMQLFQDEEIETYLNNLFKVSRSQKTLFNYVPIDSDVESKFARECEADENVTFYFKLPRGFKIPTPIGNYIPDWAVLFEGSQRIYFVAETKSTLDTQLLREIEKLKIDCGKAHFAEFESDGVKFWHVDSLKRLIEKEGRED
ncbi:DEAD/DEAH box helicase family protein [Spirosoma sp.]|uniref:restriction endonuclease n=1 Tax=Spirosoma sp. TaxID=1899569 RepID=UPI0026233BB8|nr:DEAD/DEAH box helicase family protein [Spirosoma sp.]MCX6214563.1 DEAD/DEAH box helicase family protein [Spirosoma sp.]